MFKALYGQTVCQSDSIVINTVINFGKLTQSRQKFIYAYNWRWDSVMEILRAEVTSQWEFTSKLHIKPASITRKNLQQYLTARKICQTSDFKAVFTT